MGSGVTDMWGVRHGFWMPKLRVVESRICGGSGGFGLRGEPFFGLGWVLGRGVGLEKHPDKTFIGRIEKGFDLPLLSFRPGRAIRG